MSMPIIPPFAVTASYQNSQYGGGSIYTPGIPSVFAHLVTPPTSGTEAETWSEDQGETLGFTGLAAADESAVVTLNGSPTGGTFTLNFGDDTTSALAYNASAATVAAALNALPSIPESGSGTDDVQTVTVSGSPTGGTFTLTFGGQTTSAIAYNAASSAVQSALQALSTIGTGTTNVYAEQQIEIVGAPTGGTFTLSFGGQTTSGIAYNAAASAVQSALVALSSIGSNNVTVTGQAGGPYVVAFAGTLTGPQALITSNPASLTGGGGDDNEVVVSSFVIGKAGSANVTVTGSAGGPYTVTFGGQLANALQTVMTATPSLTGGTSPNVAVVHTTPGSAGTPSASVSGSAGGPYTVTFVNLLADETLQPLADALNGDGSGLTGATLTGGEEPLTIVITTGNAAFSDASTNYWIGNQALRNQVQQYDPMVNFYDGASNNFNNANWA
jgi:hypothetical protein